MTVLAIITARGGSQQLPGKNVLPFAGKPLIAHTILAALGAGTAIDKLILSTDDGGIAKIGRAWGAEVPFIRPEALACSDTPTLPVVQHAVEHLERHGRARYDWILLLQPTSPMRTEADLRAAIKLTTTANATAVISVTNAIACHPAKLKTIEDGVLRGYQDGPIKQIRRQDLAPQVFRTNGAIYLTRRDVLMVENDFYGSKPIPYLMPPERSVDIDTQLDFDVAEFLHRRINDPRFAGSR